MTILRRPIRSPGHSSDAQRTRSLIARFCNQFAPDGGHAFIAVLPRCVNPSDRDGDSRLRILEDDRPLPHPHAIHAEIRALGLGRYSHWGECIHFASSDNSDPNTNGRRYDVDPGDGSALFSLHPSIDGLRFVAPDHLPARLFREMPLARKWCRGNGLEIGGTAYNIIRGLKTLNAGRRLDWSYIRECVRLSEGYVRTLDIVTEADDLPLDDRSTDFIFSSHVLEHMPDPIKTLLEWDRVLRHDGVMFAIVPHKDRTFDKDKPRTTLADVVGRHGCVRTGPDVPDMHYNIWIPEDLLELIEYLNHEEMVNWRVVAVEDRDSNVGNGFTVVCRKQ